MAQKRVIVFGDSMVRGLEVKCFPWPTEVIAWGGAKMNAATRADIHRRLATLDVTMKYVLVFHFGTNNVGSRNPNTRQTPAEFCGEMEKLLDSLSCVRNYSVVVSQIIPRPKKEYLEEIKLANRLLRVLCHKYGRNVRICRTGIQFLHAVGKESAPALDFFSNDGIHLNWRGKVKLSEWFAASVKPVQFLKWE